MPSSSEQAPAKQYPTVGSTYPRDGTLKPRTSGSHRGKGRRKLDAEEEDANGVPVTTTTSGEVESSPLRIPLNNVSSPSVGQTTYGVSSPLLAALGACSNTKTQHESVYPANKAPFGQSLPDTSSTGNSVSGSPPDLAGQTEVVRGGFSPASPPVSPSAAYRRPVRPNNGYQSFGEYLGSSPGKIWPVSMHTQKSIYPPPPHQPQAHFYGAPEIDFGVPRARSQNMPPADDLCCMFDTLSLAGNESTRKTEDVLLVGFEHGLNIYSVGETQPTCIGRLEGLRGSVTRAKILPSHSRVDPLRSCRPLVAVVIHGRYQNPGIEDDSRPGTSHSGRSSFSASASMLEAMEAAGNEEMDPEASYQTTVEVFSLKERKHLATLLRGPKTRLEPPQAHPYVHAIPPSTSFQLQASGQFIIVASGTSGEVFVFNNVTGHSKDTQTAFKCVGKLWTRTSRKRMRSLSTTSDTPEFGSPYDRATPKSQGQDVALFSLNHRWLAVVPPISSTQDTLHLNVDKNRSAQKIPGLLSHTSPTEPSVNCETDVPETERLLNKVARDVTQELMKGARWVGGQGMQAWSNYWSKPSFQDPTIPQTAFPSYPQQPFPPTHANDRLPTTKSGQPTTVSILDLEKLWDGHLKPEKALQPVATFSVPNGCSWVSFAPGGLNLLTVSMKGDVQQVWSLMRMIHGEPGRGTAHDPNGRAPFVREIKRFTRLTVANIVDVVWTEPHGESLAILTERGTVHINEIPAAALQWPPPRRLLRPATAPSQSSTEDKDLDVAVPAASTGSAFGAAFSMVSERTQPLLAVVRGRPASVGALSSWAGLGLPTGAGAKGGKVVAAGFNRSVGAATGTVNSLRHMGENRLALPRSPNVVMPGCVRWLGGQNRGLIAVTGGNIIKIHSVSKSTNAKGKRRPSVTARKASEFTLPSSRSVSRRRVLDHAEGSRRSGSSEGFWDSAAPSRQSRRRMSNIHPLSYAEIYTNAPYQPFHTDRRVSLYVYSDDPTTKADGNEAWPFGESIPCTKISAGSADPQDERVQGQPGHLENLVQDQGHQLVVTTRRKRNQDSTERDQGGFFDDDCEVVDFAEDRV